MKKYLLLGVIVLLIVGVGAYVALADNGGPSFPTTVADQHNGDGWANPTAVEVSDGIPAIASSASGGFNDSGDLFTGGYGFNIPTNSIINGVTVEVFGRSRSVFSNPSMDDLTIRLLKAGVLTGSNLATHVALPIATTTRAYGSSSNLWGSTWTPSDINSSIFGVDLNYEQSGPTGSQAYIDYVQITITYSIPLGPSIVVINSQTIIKGNVTIK